MTTLSIDIETRSGADIGKAGMYRYAFDDLFQIILFAYSIDDQPVQIIDLTKEELPDEIIQMIVEPGTLKYAFNAAFERVCLTRHLQQTGHLKPGQFLDPQSWRCTMVWCSALGLPRSLAAAGKALKLDQQKLAEGKHLINHFCLPLPELNQQNTLFETTRHHRFNQPVNFHKKWEEFKTYCVRDVEVEINIRHKLEKQPLPEQTWQDYAVDQRINDRGIRIDTALAVSARKANIAHIGADKQQLVALIEQILGRPANGTPADIRETLSALEFPLKDLRAETVADALETATGRVRELLYLQQSISKTSAKKYDAMINAHTSATGRLHGLIQFYGAGRTGRWAGRLVQVQNLPRNYLEPLGEARKMLKAGDVEGIELFFAPLPEVLSQLIRTAFIPADGKKFIVADYSAIEARVLAWLAGETHTLDAFRRGEDLYCATASRMFGVPVEKHGANAHLRQKGKIAVLACGYQGGPGALTAMGALKMGLKEDELVPLVVAWRKANPHVVQFWRDVNQAAIRAISTGSTVTLKNLVFTKENGALKIQLPSGRCLFYPGATVVEDIAASKKQIQFNSYTRGGLAGREKTYGGKLVENVTQAVARDLLAYALANLEAAGYPVVMHIHDEAVVEAEKTTTVDEICRLMAKAPAWAAGLPMEADGYETPYYKKD